jgi:hypothetical protein
VNPAADIIMDESASAITTAQRIPIKNIVHFLIIAESMDVLGFLTIKISIKGYEKGRETDTLLFLVTIACIERIKRNDYCITSPSIGYDG